MKTKKSVSRKVFLINTGRAYRMEDLKQTLRSTMVEAISVFEELERKGIDLSKYNV